MNPKTNVIKKLVAGLLLVVLAAGASFIIKELLSARNPELTLPDIRIEYAGEGLPQEHWMMQGYSWRFLTLKREWSNPDEEAWRDMEAAPVLPDTTLNISFNPEAQNVVISRTTDESGTFQELGGVLQTPLEPGVYTYKIEASWGVKGSILYFVKVRIVDSNA